MAYAPLSVLLVASGLSLRRPTNASCRVDCPGYAMPTRCLMPLSAMAMLSGLVAQRIASVPRIWSA